MSNGFFGEDIFGPTNPFDKYKPNSVPNEKIQKLINRFHKNIIKMEDAGKIGKELSERGIGKKEAYKQFVECLRGLIL